MLTRLNFTVLQTGICNFEFYGHYPQWYLSKHIAIQGHLCSSPHDRLLRQFRKKNDEQFASITPDSHRALSCGLLQLRLILSCGWIRVAAVSSPGGWMQVTTESRSGGWIKVKADSNLRLTRVPAAGYGLRPTPSNGWLEFWRLDTSYTWLHSTADSSSGGWIRLKADSILRLTRAPAARYELQLILSCG